MDANSPRKLRFRGLRLSEDASGANRCGTEAKASAHLPRPVLTCVRHARAAFRQNPYLFVVLPLAAVYLAGEAVCYVWGKRPLWKRKWMVIVFGLVLVVGTVFALLRNLPGFEALGPF